MDLSLRSPILCHGYKNSEHKDFDEKGAVISGHNLTAKDK